ncbi:MAG: tetratricopeptide repeat protein [Bacteroidota bacterium]
MSNSIKYYLLFFFFVISSNLIVAQQNKIDSLLNLINLNKLDDTIKVNKLTNLAYEYDKIEDVKNAEKYFNSSLEISKKINFKYGIANNYYGLAALNYDASSYNNSLTFYNNALKLYEELSDSVKISDCFNMIGDINRKQARYHVALDYYLKSLKIREDKKLDKRVASVNNNIGLVYLELKNYEKALSFFNKALTTAKKENNKYTLCRCYNRIGIVYDETEQNDKALDAFKLSYNYANEINDNAIKWISSGNIATLYLKLNNYDSALYYNLISTEIAKQINNKEGLCSNYKSLAFIYLKKNQYNLALNYLKQAEKLALELEINDDLMETYQGLSTVYEKTNNFELAYRYHVKFKQLTDSIFNIENSKQIGDLKTQFEVDKKENELKAKAIAQEIINLEEKKNQQTIIYAVIFILIIAVTFTVFLFNRFKVISKQKNIIESQKKQVEIQRDLVEEKQKEILDSITYAKRLQQAILPPSDFISKYTNKYFVFFKPKDIVAGDFYWAKYINDKFFIAAADCTGHGVPGAMVSLVCSNALNQAVKEFNLTDTGKILDKTRELVVETFEKSTDDVKDGMDISLLCIDKKNKKITWSGANNPLWFVVDNKIMEIKADKQSIGKTDNLKPFTTHHIDYTPNSIFYLFTDGFADQFGGESGKKFKYKPLSNLLLKNSFTSLENQSQKLNEEFINWKGDLEQVDDVCIIGIGI